MARDKWGIRELTEADRALSCAIGSPLDVEAVLAAVRAGGDPNFPTSHGCHLIDTMAWYREVEGVRTLLALGAHVEHPDAHLPTLFRLIDQTRRHGAADDPKVHALVKLFLESGASPHYVHPVSGNGVLAAATLLGDEAVVRALLEAGAAHDVCNADGESVLALARARGHRELEAVLVAFGAEPLPATHDADLLAQQRAIRVQLIETLRSGAQVLHKQDYGPPRDSTWDYYFYWEDGWREIGRYSGRYARTRQFSLDSDEAVIAWLLDNFSQRLSTESALTRLVALQQRLQARPASLPRALGEPPAE